MVYVELTLSSLADAARAAFEKLMQDPNYEFQTEFARKFFEGRTQAHQEGRQEGVREGRQEDLLAVLSARGLTVSTEARQRILACMDPEQLRSWLLKALTATSVLEIFEPGQQPG